MAEELGAASQEYFLPAFPQLWGRFSFWEEEDRVNCPKNFLCLNSSRFVRAATLICCGQASWEALSYGLSIVLCWQSSR